MQQFASTHGLVYEQVDEVHVVRAGTGSDWRIERVVGISET